MPLVSSVLEHAVVASTLGLGFYLMASLYNQFGTRRVLMRQLYKLQADLRKEKEKRAADRAGRIRAEQQLKEARLQLVTEQAKATTPLSSAAAAVSGGEASITGQPATGVYPLRPIGTLRSCFTQRNGTPRQPLLVPAARAVLELAPGLPSDMLQGLEQYSHCWVVYLFHHNTDLAKALDTAGPGGHIKAKVRVPRLDGAKMGVLATRSPHRPVPIGLSVGQVISTRGGMLVLGGLDVVDGSPVLDIKPYLPFVDGVAGATAPPWVREAADEEPLAVEGVELAPGAVDSIRSCWRQKRQQLSQEQVTDQQQQQQQQGAQQGAEQSDSAPREQQHAGRSSSSSIRTKQPPQRQQRQLYRKFEDYLELVQQVLSRDIRSVHQRLKAGPHVVPGGRPCDSSTISTGSSSLTGDNHQGPGAAAAAATAAAVATGGAGSSAAAGLWDGALHGPEPDEAQEPAATAPAPVQQNGCGATAPAAAAGGSGASAAGGVQQGHYHVVLEGIDVHYDITAKGLVILRGAQLHRQPE